MRLCIIFDPLMKILECLKSTDYSTQNINHGAPHNLLLHTRDSMHTIVFNAPFPRYNVAFNVVFNGVQPMLSIRTAPQYMHHTETMNRCIDMLQCIHCSNYSTHSLLKHIHCFNYSTYSLLEQGGCQAIDRGRAVLKTEVHFHQVYYGMLDLEI